MLEKLTTARIESAADLYDWDELVQEDRVHRLIYTDPAIFQAEMTNIFGAVWVYLGHESQIPKNDDYITTRARPAPDHPVARLPGQDPRAVQPLHPSRHHALPQGQRLGAHVHLPLSRLELSQHRQAARRAVAGRLCLRLQGREVQRRAGAARRQLSRLHLRHAQSRRAAAARLSRRHHQADRRMARPPAQAARSRCARRTGSNTRATGSSPTTIPATAITSCSRTARCWRWRTAWPTTPTRACRITRARRTRRPMYMAYMGNGHHFKDKRPNIEKRAGGLWAVEGPAPGTEHYDERIAPTLRRQGRGNPRSRLLRARQHQRVPELLAARQPHPGVRAGLGRRDQRHLVRHRRGRRGRHARRRGRRDQCAAHAHAGAVPEFRRGRRPRQFRGDPARACVPGGRVGLHAPRARHSRPREDRRERRSSPRPPPTRRSCANTSRNGSG